MTASLLQLVAIGSEDYYFVGNPQISHFKQINMRYTNFSIERVQLYNESNRNINISVENTYNFKINTEHGDLLRSTYLHLKLPEIYCPEGYQFKWIKNMGSMIIEEATLVINGTIIEVLDSHTIDILNNMTLNKKTTDIYNSSICNTREYYDPGMSDTYPYSKGNLYTSDNNINSLDHFNINHKLTESIQQLNLHVPLPFFFNRLKIVNIPICALRNAEVGIRIKLRPLRELYTISRETKYTLGVNISATESDNLTNEIIRHTPYSYKILDDKNIKDFIQSIHQLDDIDISLMTYVIFLDSDERYKFSTTKYSALISVPAYYSFLGQEGEVDLKIENNNVVKEMYIFSQRNDVLDTNNWSNYSIYDHDSVYRNRKLYQNYYLKLAMLQYDTDTKQVSNIVESHRNLKLNLYSSGNKYSVSIKYLTNTGEVENISLTNIDFANLPSYIEVYFNLLTGIIHDTHSLLYYYGMFRKYGTNKPLLILSDNFKYRIFNSNNATTDIISLKYIPTFTVENLSVHLDFTNPRFTDSIVDSTYIKYKESITSSDIDRLLDIWSHRDLNKIPYIDDRNIDYFHKSNIIESILIKADGNPINNIQDHTYSSYGKIYEAYTNCNIENILYYPFSEFPGKYQPSGHLNLDTIDNLHINLVFKNSMLDTMDYKFNTYIYLMVYKILNIEKDNVSLLL